MREPITDTPGPWSDGTLDEDGYPTEEFLQSIKDWPHQNGFNELLEHAMSGHTYPNYWERISVVDGDEWAISTGGWSGNESILAALKSNTLFWLCCWVQSKRGGHYLFKVKTPTAIAKPEGRE